MPITIAVQEDGTCSVEKGAHPKRQYKGKSKVAFPQDYTVLDLETTGLSPSFDDIIEISALRVRNSEVVDSFSSLVKPRFPIDSFITELTGITNDMVKDAPSIRKILPSVREFLGHDIIVGHNANFDMNFMYDNFYFVFDEPFTNDFIDTMRMARKVLPELPHHRLIDVSEALGVTPDGAHRALADCKTTYDCFCKLRDTVISGIGIDAFTRSFFYYNSLDVRGITSTKTEFDETHPLFGKRCVFTGTLEKMSRAEAAQAVVDVGGICDNGITKKTNFLILGNTDYQKTGGGKSSKHRKAEEYKLKGVDIEVIPENVFYDMLEI